MPAAATAALLCLLLAAPRPSHAQQSILDGELLLEMKKSFSNGDTVLASWVPGTDPCNKTAPWLGCGCELGPISTDYVTYV